MSTPDISGSAFPVSEEHGANSGDCGITRLEYFMAHVDVSIYNPMESLTRSIGRQFTVKELAEYVAGIRILEARAMIEASK